MSKVTRLNDFFDQIYYINLNSRPDRLSSIKEQLEMNNVTAKRVAGIQQKFSVKKKINNAELGLILTQKLILIDAIRNNYKSILILEDDAIFCTDFIYHFDAAVAELPDDWDLFYLGGQYWLAFPEKFSKHVSIANRILGSHALGIKSTVFETMLNISNFSEAGDQTFADKQKDLKSYITKKTLIDQKDGITSDIQKTNPHIHIKPFRWEIDKGRYTPPS
ncbi:Glycosyl transferase, family 25 [uncultured Caudovirales phage]|uniref:Glycosyl transferase, family 25 n=1 Tax=uncultured Caudovirales phage TaxID=2100421 RepID=A0A6J5NGX2_9CAUD|nr:Glycosyl transferase, family 25 [uncultured Caudovirales phage]